MPREIYLSAAARCRPHWLRMIGPTPWLTGVPRQSGDDPHHPVAIYRQCSSMLATALLGELDADRYDADHLREVVRGSLIQWALRLQADGRPAHRGLRRSDLTSVAASQVVQLFSETAGFGSDLLLGEVKRHVRWLTRKRTHAPWVEASLVATLADAAVLVRDSDLLKIARARLGALLSRQTDEGWFPEQHGPDIARLSLTVDALARLYRQTDWSELRQPLQRALKFITHFVHPDGSIGGCYSSCGGAFVSPYGPELLADEFPEAAMMAICCRRLFSSPAGEVLMNGDDDVCAALGPALLLAADCASRTIDEGAPLPSESFGQTRFPQAGITIFSTAAYYAIVAGTRGAIHVSWRNGEPDLVDGGVILCYACSLRHSGATRRGARMEISESSATSTGALKRTARRRKKGWPSFIHWLRPRADTPSQPGAVHRSFAPRDGHAHEPRIPIDGFRRKITLGDGWIRIDDRVRCTLPCEAAVLQSPSPALTPPFGGAVAARSARAPIFLPGGRNLSWTRVYREGRLLDQTEHGESTMQEAKAGGAG